MLVDQSFNYCASSLVKQYLSKRGQRRFRQHLIDNGLFYDKWVEVSHPDRNAKSIRVHIGKVFEENDGVLAMFESVDDARDVGGKHVSVLGVPVVKNVEGNDEVSHYYVPLDAGVLLVKKAA